ncbi:hypothetical protein ACHWQZ_G005104 [Mnemiopsis leidyi]
MVDGELKAERTSYTWIGKYVTTTFNLAQSEPCSAGTFRPTNQLSCVLCEEGTVSTESGATFCTSCDLGKVANSDKTQCDPCQAGNYRDSSMLECKPCPSGTISAEGAGLCTGCPQRSLANEEQTKCESCEGLPESWKEIKTETQFPLPPGSEVSLKCSTGYTLTGDKTVTCTEGTTFSFTETPLCVLDKCSQLPDISNLKTETQFPVSYNVLVTVKCSSGYSLEGSDVITCIKEKNYKSIDGYLPACNKNICTGMMIENYLSTNASYPITYGTAITVACDPQYDLLGSEVITCERGIVYSHSSRRPKCVSKVQYRLTHTTGTGKWDGGTHSGDLFFTLIGKLGVTGSHDCPADRGFGKTASCTFEDEANIGGLVKMKIENINGNNWAFTKLFVAVDGEVRAARTSYTWINRYKNTTFRLANIIQYKLTHTTGTGKNSGGAYSEAYDFTIKGEEGETGAHDCPADRGAGKTGSCTIEDAAEIGKLTGVRIKNKSNNYWQFMRMVVEKSEGWVWGWSGEKNVNDYETKNILFTVSYRKKF